ncbi:helix-turn-helix domain-containing protein [Microbacterium sp. SL75]|uniref:helix-turn-helix domain-containing protein n=1 Tax=Microbacterium sp. SL75 TaxID=2995140 RepID=UPI00226F5594|nr:helix-turn-helix transcriptional regulator [Microbacterium sp. SL75]WAC69279.1 helix-turn-helix transcriptional regulator [Microbacterium sp. SL75]
MVRQKKTPHPFDAYLGTAIRASRTRRGMTRETLARRTGIALSNLKRREDGVNETSVSELERIAAVLQVPTTEIVGMALVDYSGGGGAQDGLQMLLESMSEASPIVDDEDNVTYIGRTAPGLRDAANTDERTTTD